MRRSGGWLGLILILLVMGFTVRSAATYYVAPIGSDLNDGLSLVTPFKTIQHCASVAVAGDTCLIRAGTYRETIRPLHSGTALAPIIVKAYNHESVILSGADVITSAWTLHNGAIYRTPLASTRPC